MSAHTHRRKGRRKRVEKLMFRDDSRPARIRLFRNEKLEELTLVTPLIFASTWAVVLAVALYASWGAASIGPAVLLVLLGLLIWSIFEYAMHRFVFHWKTTSRLGNVLVFLAHGNHHADPNDPLRNLMPPLVSVGISGSIWALLYLLLGPIGSVIFLGFGIGYVVYDSVHYACHQKSMRWRVLRDLRRHHIRHHHAKQEGNYAITAIFWDWVFGTMIPAKKR